MVMYLVCTLVWRRRLVGRFPSTELEVAVVDVLVLGWVGEKLVWVDGGLVLLLLDLRVTGDDGSGAEVDFSSW